MSASPLKQAVADVVVVVLCFLGFCFFGLFAHTNTSQGPFGAHTTVNEPTQ